MWQAHRVRVSRARTPRVVGDGDRRASGACLTPHRPPRRTFPDFITANERYFLYFLLSAGFLFIMCVVQDCFV